MLFTIGPLPVTNSMICTWIVAAVIFVMVASDDLEEHQGDSVGHAERDGGARRRLGRLMGDMLEPKVAALGFSFCRRRFSSSSSCPTCGSASGRGQHRHAGSRPRHSSLPLAIQHVETPVFPSADDGCEPDGGHGADFSGDESFLGGALQRVLRGLIKHIFGVKVETNKWSYPLLFLLFLFIGAMEMVSIVFARPVALAMRLYGNIFAGESMLDDDAPQHTSLWPGLLLPCLFLRIVRLRWCRRLCLRCWSWRLSARCARTTTGRRPAH